MTNNTGTSRLGLVIVAMTIGNAIILVSQTAVPLALPSIMAELGVGSDTAQWVLTASLLPLAGFMVLAGRLADLIGLRRMFVLGSIVFAAASLASGLAPSFELLIAFRVVQGLGGALILPTSVAIVSAAARGSSAGRALGTVGGAAAVAGACGPIIGGVLTSAFGWRAVMLVNIPLAILAVLIALAVVARDAPITERPRVDLIGAALLCITLVGVVFGVTQSQSWGWASPGVIGPLAAAVIAATAFVIVERRTAHPLVDFALFRKYQNYAGATISQGIGGVVEMGLGILFPLLLILNLGLDPAVAGLALLPTTLPMVLVAPLAGRWYDKVGGRIPLVTGFIILAAAAAALYIGASFVSLPALIPGLLLYGIGLALVLTINDPVSLDQIPKSDQGQASGVSATAEQFGGALGIAGLYAVYHTTYLTQLDRIVAASPLADLTSDQAAELKNGLIAAEQTGLNPGTFPADVQQYLIFALDASTWGFAIAFLVAGVAALAGAGLSWALIRRVP
jgi:EmrB/QacA subfamily drug resistance transporter